MCLNWCLHVSPTTDKEPAYDLQKASAINRLPIVNYSVTNGRTIVLKKSCADSEPMWYASPLKTMPTPACAHRFMQKVLLKSIRSCSVCSSINWRNVWITLYEPLRWQELLIQMRSSIIWTCSSSCTRLFKTPLYSDSIKGYMKNSICVQAAYLFGRTLC